MKLTAYTLGLGTPQIRPAPVERLWMDQTPQSFAYRCLPLNIANAHGWEVLCPQACRITWLGGRDLNQLTIEGGGAPHQRPISHFGSGIVTFHLGCLMKTEPGVELWVGGPPNRPKHGIYPLTGVVETDWSPFTFTMNWMLTQPGQIVFEKGEPYCFFFPVNRALMEEVEPEFKDIDQDPDLAKEFRAWQASRGQFNEDLKEGGSEARKKGWQRTYFQGHYPSGEPAPEGHRTRQRVPPFKPA